MKQLQLDTSKSEITVNIIDYLIEILLLLSKRKTNKQRENIIPNKKKMKKDLFIY